MVSATIATHAKTGPSGVHCKKNQTARNNAQERGHCALVYTTLFICAKPGNGFIDQISTCCLQCYADDLCFIDTNLSLLIKYAGKCGLLHIGEAY